MNKLFFLKTLQFMVLFFAVVHLSHAQNTHIEGKVTDSRTGEGLAGVNIIVKDKVVGVSTNIDGNFTISVKMTPPLTLVVSYIGYTSREIEITEANTSGLEISLEEAAIFGEEVVISASRVEESILESPVSIEKMDILAIRDAAAPSFYDAIRNLKGVDVSSQSLTFKSVNARGFGSNGNERFVQLIDGIDNQAPGLNFPVGNVVGISELDLESVELIPGAASALYGPNALNGILLLRSKSPFDYQGLSFSTKMGVNHIDNRDHEMSMYQNYSLRYAKVIGSRFAFKVVGDWLRAEDFIGVDYRDKHNAVEWSQTDINPFVTGYRSGTNEASMRTYNGVSVYGDDVFNVGSLGEGTGIEALLPRDEYGDFSVTGYPEKSFVDNRTESFKFGTGLHYRLTDNLELLGQFNIGYGSTVYTGNDRYQLDNFSIWTAKMELKGIDGFVRAYTTREDAGNSFAGNTLATLINASTTIPAYVQSFAALRMGGASVDEAHFGARNATDAMRESNLENGTYTDLYNDLKSKSIAEGGALFIDKSAMNHVEGMYNLSEKVKIFDLLVGGNFRQFLLNSEKSLFALDDNGNEFTMNEWGAYTQLSKSLLDEKLDLKAAVRYDKNQNFVGQFSPRVSAVYSTPGKQNFRVSFQRGFRIPTTQDQYIDLDVVSARLIGSNQTLIDRYNFNSNPVFLSDKVLAAKAVDDPSMLSPYEAKPIRTEKVNTIELGYKGLLGKKAFIDAYYYRSTYIDFIQTVWFDQAIPNGLTEDSGYEGDPTAAAEAIVNNTDPVQTFQFDINADGGVTAHGFGVSIDYSLPKGYTLGGNVSYNELLDQQDLVVQNFSARYNTPRYRYNLKFANRKLTEKIGFNVMYRWQEAFLWESSIGFGTIPDFSTVDAQVSYKLTSLKSILKIGGTNILNNRYTTSFANPSMGAIYYVSLNFEELLN